MTYHRASPTSNKSWRKLQLCTASLLASVAAWLNMHRVTTSLCRIVDEYARKHLRIMIFCKPSFWRTLNSQLLRQVDLRCQVLMRCDTLRLWRIHRYSWNSMKSRVSRAACIGKHWDSIGKTRNSMNRIVSTQTMPTFWRCWDPALRSLNEDLAQLQVSLEDEPEEFQATSLISLQYLQCWSMYINVAYVTNGMPMVLFLIVSVYGWQLLDAHRGMSRGDFATNLWLQIGIYSIELSGLASDQ